MRKKVRSTINYLLVLFFTILGLIGLALPVVPQFTFFAIALIILSFEIPAVEKYIERKLKRDGKIGKIYYSISDKVGKYLK